MSFTDRNGVGEHEPGVRVTPRAALVSALSELDAKRASVSLQNLLRVLRGRRLQAAAVLARCRVLVSILEEDEQLCAKLREAVTALLEQFDSAPLVAEAGVPILEGFWAGISRHVGHALLPPVFADSDLRGALHQLFRPSDAAWLSALAATDLLPILCRGLMPDDADFSQDRNLVTAARILAYRIAALGLESELAGRVPASEGIQEQLSDLPILLHQCFALQGADLDAWSKLQDCLSRCETMARYLRIYHRAHGTSPRMTALTLRLKLQIRRLRELLRVLHPSTEDLPAEMSRLVGDVLIAEIEGGSLRAYFRDTTRILALEVTGHGAHHGAGYIMQERRDYWHFFLRSLGAGVLVAIFGNLKLKLPHDTPPFWGAALYSLNYVACFVLIYVTGSALATKQPAMTAATVAETLDESDEDEASVRNLADLIQRVIRSQLVSFAGNLLSVVPLSLLLTWAVHRAFGADFISRDQARNVLTSLHPLHSGSLLFAGLTGVWLFVSGLVTGYIDNHVLFARIARRLENHPRFVKYIPETRRAQVASFIDRHLGGVTGNVVFGVLLGGTAAVAGFFGLPVDIRHITFSAAHFSVSSAILFHRELPGEVLLIASTVLGIGAINFCVSFSLALITALKSRGLPLSDLKFLLRAVRHPAPQKKSVLSA